MADGFIYVGLAENKPMYTVEVEFLDGGLPSSRGEKAPGKISCSDPIFIELSFSRIPLWFGLKGENMRYDVVARKTACA